ncbi:MAG: hypothetical protein GQ544_01465, partial [Candidatus Aminicenantes bacterium]|nr:hypothetical protein [Candidatus Aminicenantes bacterium]
MRIFYHLRYKQYILKIRRRLRTFFILAVLALVLFGAGTAVKNLVLDEIKDQIQSVLGYDRLYVSTFPPALVIEDARSVSSSPFFSAEKIQVRVSLKSLLSPDKLFQVFVDKPVLRIFSSAGRGEDLPPLDFSLALPFIIEKGIIKDGELYFWGEETRIHSIGINAIFKQSGENYSLQAEIDESTFVTGAEYPQVQVGISLVCEGKAEDIEVKKLRVNGAAGYIRASGRVTNLLDPEIQLDMSYNLETLFIADFFNLPFFWKGRGEGRGVLTRKEGLLAFDGGMTSNNLVLNDVPMGTTNGRIQYNQRTGGAVELNFRKRGSQSENVNIRFTGSQVTGTAQGLYLQPVLNYLQLPWPVASPAWGSFSINRGKLQADLEFRDELIQLEPQKYPFLGKVSLQWDGKDRIDISSPELETNFARFAIEGYLLNQKELDITLRGDIKDARAAREFTELILERTFTFHEIRGEGQAGLHLFGDFYFPQIKADFAVKNAGFDKFEAEYIKGDAELIRKDFFGRFEVNDPEFKGRIGLFSNENETRIDIRLEEGRIEKILAAFDIELPLRGEGSGYFEYTEKNQRMHYNGTFASEKFDLAGQELTDVAGKIEGDEALIHFPELSFGFHGGRVAGSALMNPLTEEFDIDVEVSQIDLSSFYPSLSGTAKFDLEGKGTFGQDVVTGTYALDDLHLLPFQPTRSEGKITLDYVDDVVSLKAEGNFFPGENEYSLTLNVSMVEDSLTGEIKGVFNNYDILMPWQGSEGRINYRADLYGSRLAPNIKGVIDLQGSLLPFPRFAHALRDFSGLIFVTNGNLDIRSFQGKFGGGDLKGSGFLEVGKAGVEKIDFRIEGRDMSLALMERTAARVDGDLRLLLDEERFVLEGDILVNRLNWKREVDEKFAFASAAYQQDRREAQFFDDLTLNIRVRALDNAWIDNALGRIRGRFDLTLTGNIYNPVMLGDIELLDGNVEFQDRSFEVLQGRISFFNPAVIEPYITFRGEAIIKDYRVEVKLDGLLDSLNPELTSSPPLPPEDVYALIALGEAFRRTYRYDQAMTQGTASLLSFTLSEEAKRSAERLFMVDQFRIDPFVMGSSSEVTARLTVGKRVSRNL